MGHKEVKSCIESCGIKAAHWAFIGGTAPALPWAVFYQDGMDGAYADDVLYAANVDWVVELYERTLTPKLEAALEAAITRDFGAWARSEAWISEEECLQVTYRFSEVQSNLD